MTVKENRPSLLLIYTGGTIGMVQDPATGALKPFRFDNIIETVPELKKTGFRISTFSFDPALDSSNMNHAVWKKLALLIESNYEKFDGFIVLHGTDTMAYSASALSFMLENLGKPVIFTGSQLPMGSVRTDGTENLVTSTEIAAATANGRPAIPEVAIYFENSLFRGNRTSKNSTEHFGAFISGNYPPLAQTGVHIKYNYSLVRYPDRETHLKVHPDLDTNVFILKIYPGIREDFVRAVLNMKALRAVILETFGAGNAPEEEWFPESLEEAMSRGIIILNVTQCVTGNVEMGRYETSRKLARAGVLSGGDMTTEAALAKLMHLLALSKDIRWISSMMGVSLRGEITV
jgi:L-asparaginase